MGITLFLQVQIIWDFKRMFPRFSRYNMPIFEWKNFKFVNLQIFFQKEWIRAVLRGFLVVEAQVCAATNLYFYFLIFCFNVPVVKTKKISKFGMKLSKRQIVMAKIVKTTISSQSLCKSAFSPRFLVMKRSFPNCIPTKHHD